MSNDGLLEPAVEFIAAHRALLVTSHLLPDADAIGSCIAMRALLEARGLDTGIVLPSPVPRRYEFTRSMAPLHTWPDVDSLLERPWDGLIVLDSSDWSRIGPLAPLFEQRFAGHILAIDHHPGHAEFATVTVVDRVAPATASLVYQLIVEYCQMELEPAMATALMIGLQGDTGSFSYANTSSDAFRMAARLVDAGCDLGRLTKRLNADLTLADLAFVRAALGLVETKLEGRLGWLALPYELFARHGASIQRAFPLMRFVRGLSGVELAVVLYEDERSRVKISLRSDGTIDVGELARAHGGGGHRAAAGMMLTCTLAEAEAKIFPDLLAALNIPEDEQ